MIKLAVRAGFPLWVGLSLAAGLLAACGDRRAGSAPAAAPAIVSGDLKSGDVRSGDVRSGEPRSGEASYLAPPAAASARVGPDGTLAVTGVAPPGSLVEIMSPEGEQAHVRADRRGGWSSHLAGSAQPHLYAISATLQGRTVHAEGALITAPGAATPAVMVRAGDAAYPLRPDRATGIASVDYDPSGFIAGAGFAPPHAQLTLAVDGAPAAVGQADGAGRYALLAANRRLAMGAHRLQVRAPAAAPERQVTLEPPVALAAPYQAWPGPDGWRVEWGLNGGGVQTTLILGR